MTIRSIWMLRGPAKLELVSVDRRLMPPRKPWIYESWAALSKSPQKLRRLCQLGCQHPHCLKIPNHRVTSEFLSSSPPQEGACWHSVHSLSTVQIQRFLISLSPSLLPSRGSKTQMYLPVSANSSSGRLLGPPFVRCSAVFCSWFIPMNSTIATGIASAVLLWLDSGSFNAVRRKCTQTKWFNDVLS